MKPWPEKFSIIIVVLLFGLLLLQSIENITLTRSSSSAGTPPAGKTMTEWEKTFADKGLTLYPAQFWKTLE